MPGDMPPPPDQPPNGGEQPKEGEFEGRTYLYIRTNPADTGVEPLAAGLQFWTSPDIWIVKPGGAVGGQAVPNQVNQVQVTVTNAGGIPAIDALVDAFVADPSTVITPATATLIGSGYLDIPGYSTAQISFPWTPQPADAGHRCIVARVSLVAPLDTYTNPGAFEVVQDRHVAQRNIQVLAVAQGQTLSFPFFFGGKANLESIRVVERTREMRLADVVELAGRIGGLPAKVPLAALGIHPAEKRESREERERLVTREARRRAGVAGRAAEHAEADLVQRPGNETQRNAATLTFRAHEKDEAGRLHVIDVVELDARGNTVGGLTFVVQVE